MAIKTVVTRGYGNGTFSGTIADVSTRGYTIGAAVATTPGGSPITEWAAELPIEQVIYQRAKNGAAGCAVNQRVYTDFAPQAVSGSYIILSTEETEHEQSLDGGTNLGQAFLEVSCFATSKAAGFELMELAESDFGDWVDEFTQPAILWSHSIGWSTRPSVEPNRGQQRAFVFVANFEIQYRELSSRFHI